MSKTILLADDSVTIRKVVELTFMEESYELVSFGGGDEAVGQLAGLDPDLVIADIHMPGVTGYDVCRAAKEQRPERPVLLLVGTFEPFDEDEIAASNADGHLKKPFDSQELLRTVRELLAGAEAATGPDEAAESAPDTGDDDGEDPLPEAVDGAFEVVAPPTETVADETLAAVAAPAEPAAAETPAPPAEGAGNGEAGLSDEMVDRIARRVAEILGPDVVRDVAWEVVPDLAEVVIKERLRELESQVE